MAHLGRPKGEVKDEFSLKHIVDEVSKVLGQEVKFVDECVGEKAEKLLLSLNREKFFCWRICVFIMKRKKAMKLLQKSFLN
jgi:3-phosphoglycerate kinase